MRRFAGFTVKGEEARAKAWYLIAGRNSDTVFIADRRLEF